MTEECTGLNGMHGSADSGSAASEKWNLRRAQIMNAAEECFKKKGFHSSTMSEIARHFGMSASHIYNYFENKESIIEAIVQRDLHQSLERIDALIRHDDILLALIDAVDEGLKRRSLKSAIDVEILAEAARNPKVAQTVRHMDQQLRARLAQLLCQIRPPLNADDQATLMAKSAFILSIFDGMMSRGIRQTDADTTLLADLIKQTIRNLFTGDTQ